MRLFLQCMCFVLLAGAVRSHEYFRNLIPNGFYVPFPCDDFLIWPGVGHINSGGGGANNQFGLDFKDAGYKWTKDLCEKDSDGDGRSNGKELGDPRCVWKAFETPEITTGITNPGKPDSKCS